MKRIIAIILVISSIAVYAGVSRTIGINIRKSDGMLFDFSGTNPDPDGKDGVTFYAYIKSRPDEQLNNGSAGCGYTYSAASTPQLSSCRVNIGNYPTEWAAGDSIVFVIHQDLSKGGAGLTKIFRIPEGTTGIHYGFTTGYIYDGPWCLGPLPQAITTVLIGTEDFNGNIFDFGSSPYDNVTFQCWVSGKEDKIYDQSSSGSYYFDYSPDASAIRIYESSGWTSDDTLNVRIKQDLPDIGYYTGFKQFIFTYTYTTGNHWMDYPYYENIKFGLVKMWGEEWGVGEPVKADVWTDYPSSLDTETVPAETALYQNFPNPFNPVTQIRFALSKTADVKLSVYNISGQLVSQLASGVKNAGHHIVDFDGSKLNSGVYYYTLEGDGKTMTKKMLLVK
jgi:hypothetical protein